MVQHAVKALANLLLGGILIVNEMSVLAKCILLTSVESADTCACLLFACKRGRMRCES